MEVNITKEGDMNMVSIIGRLDTTTANDLDKAIESLFCPGAKVVFECEELLYVSSSGLRIILQAHKKLQMVGSTLVLRHVCQEIMSVFKMTGFSAILKIEN